MADTSLNPSYSLVANTLPETEGYHAVVSHVGSVDAETFFSRVAARRPGLDASTAELVLSTVCMTAAEILSERQYRVSLADVSFELAIPGSTDSMDGKMAGPAYVAVRVSSSLRNAAAGVAPVYAAGDGMRTDVFSVESLATRRHGEVDVAEQFRIAGVNLSASGEDESLKVAAADGTEADAEVVAEDGVGRFITARLAAALPPGKGKVVMTTHGKRTPEGELRVLAKSVTIVAGEPTPPPPPTPIAQTSDGQVKVMALSGGEGGSYSFGDTWVAQGEGFRDSESGWFVELGMLLPTPQSEPVNLDCHVASATELDITASEGAEVAAGDYPNAAIQIGMAHYVEGELVSETLEIPIHLTVE